jgi:hypothetical protein
MSDAEGKILKIYDKSKPETEDLFDSSNWNHLAWCLALAFAALAFWLSIALVNAENQRNALMTNQCQDRSSRDRSTTSACARCTRATTGGNTCGTASPT